MLWTAKQYAAHANIPLRTAQWRLARWRDNGAVRVLVEHVAATGRAPARDVLRLDVADWCRATGNDPVTYGLPSLPKAA